jgi:hypothetical protein
MKRDQMRIFPFLPKSNASLRPGDFWGMEIAPGTFAAGRVVELPSQHNDFSDRRWFLAGLMDWCGKAPPTSIDLENRKMLEQGSMHVKAFAFSNWMIDGNRDLLLDNIEPWLVKTALIGNLVQKGLGEVRPTTRQEASKLPLQCAWGVKVIELSAQHHFLEQKSQPKPGSFFAPGNNAFLNHLSAQNKSSHLRDFDPE